MDAKPLSGRTALVTGASAGIGLACARALARDGATVVIVGRAEDALAGARAEIARETPTARVEPFVGDGCKEDQVKAALAFAHGLDGRLDILVPTVGGGVMQPLLMRDADSVRQELEINFLSVFMMVRHGVPLMGRGGAIVCISTAAVNQAFWGLSLYGASKAAMERFVRGAAFELGGAGIRINAVRPGMTRSRTTETMEAIPGVFDLYAAETPLGRIGQPEDIAQVVRFLAGPESGWVTGQCLSADGGQEQGKAPDHMDAFFGKAVMDRVRAGMAVDADSQIPLPASTSFTAPDAKRTP